MLRLGLRTRFFLYSNALIVVTMTVITILSVVHAKTARYDAIYRRGKSIADSLAIPITDALMYEDLGLVTETGLTDNYISEILRRNEDLMRYVVVTDPRGIVTHSNRWELLGQPFARAMSRTAIGIPPETQILDGDETILEVRSPLHISTRFWGAVAVGFTLEPVEREVEAIAQKAVMLAILLMIANSVLTAAYVDRLIRPLLALHRTIMRAAKGDMTVRSGVRQGDEVGELSDAFNHMMDELEEAREREKIARTQLGHTEKMVAIGTLAAGVAHEVNNPLGGIMTCIENMKAHPEDAAMQDRYLDMIHDGLNRIERTVANLLDFSRPRELRPEPTSINHNLQHVAELSAYQLRRNLVEVNFELDPREPLAMADHFQMEQLFLNLVLNALHAMPEGGTLTLATSTRDGKVAAEVRDTGTGIEKRVLDRIFDPFFTTKDPGAGTGLGLSISYAIVREHAGTLVAESVRGEGTRMRMLLPLATEDVLDRRAG